MITKLLLMHIKFTFQCYCLRENVHKSRSLQISGGKKTMSHCNNKRFPSDHKTNRFLTTTNSYLQLQHLPFHVTKLLNTCIIINSFFLYTLFNIGLVTVIHSNIPPLSTIFIVPSILSLSQLSFIRSSYLTPTFKISTSSHLTILDPTCDTSSLSKCMEMIKSNNMRLVNFTPGGWPICLDTGATSCTSIMLLQQ